MPISVRPASDGRRIDVQPLGDVFVRRVSTHDLAVHRTTSCSATSGLLIDETMLYVARRRAPPPREEPLAEVSSLTVQNLRAGEGMRTLDVNLGKMISPKRSSTVRRVESAERCSSEHGGGVEWWGVITGRCACASAPITSIGHRCSRRRRRKGRAGRPTTSRKYACHAEAGSRGT